MAEMELACLFTDVIKALLLTSCHKSPPKLIQTLSQAYQQVLFTDSRLQQSTQ
jgi:hypothetical protein